MVGVAGLHRNVLRGALVVALALGGCARTGPPAPVVQGDRIQTVPPASRQQADLPPAGHPGDAAPTGPQEGRSVMVRPGDTLYSIARDNSVPLRALIDVNRLRAPFVVEPGQRLILPRARYHIVRRGDTVYGIARRYGVDMGEIVRLNAIPPPYVIAVGQKISLPGTGPSARGAVAPPARPSREVRTTSLPAPDPTPAAEEAPRPAGPAREADPPPREGRRFLWPLRGPVIVAFGPRGGGLHNDGINIAAREGTEIRAAESGIVAYAGNELQGFGNLLLVRHAGDMMTAYAHASAILVKKGDVIRRGQVVGRVGRTGNVTRPQLHFEIRIRHKPVDPMRYLTRVAADQRSQISVAASPAGRRDPE